MNHMDNTKLTTWPYYWLENVQILIRKGSYISHRQILSKSANIKTGGRGENLAMLLVRKYAHCCVARGATAKILYSVGVNNFSLPKLTRNR